jgi:hypothetical protein
MQDPAHTVMLAIMLGSAWIPWSSSTPPSDPLSSMWSSISSSTCRFKCNASRWYPPLIPRSLDDVGCEFVISPGHSHNGPYHTVWNTLLNSKRYICLIVFVENPKGFKRYAMWRYLPYPTGSPKPLADTPSLLLLLLWSYGVNVDSVRYCIKYCTTKRPCVEFPLNVIPLRLSVMTVSVFLVYFSCGC